MPPLFRRVAEKLRLKGDESKHEQTDSWSNRDLIPLPPARRQWVTFDYFGLWTTSSLNTSNWQVPNSFLTEGLSVSQAMAIIILGRFLVAGFTNLMAVCALRWHINFTVQNRFTWVRILLSIIWNAYQSKPSVTVKSQALLKVHLSMEWRKTYWNIPNTFPDGFPATVTEFVGFILFWVISIPLLWIRPERFRVPFLVVSIYCSVGMLSMMVWSLSVAQGVGPVFYTTTSVPKYSLWNSSWLIMAGINQVLGGNVAAAINTGDFARYSKGPKQFVLGTMLSLWLLGVLVCFIGLVTTSACQKIYGEIYWNPPDLLLVMMDKGQGSSKSRAGVFFLSLGFSATTMFENVCGSAISGGIDFAGLFPRYIDIRRGAILVFILCWIVQPWQVVNGSATFITAISSFSVFLAPMMGVMACDFYILRNRKIQLSHLYRTKDTVYWYWHGFNWRAIIAWVCGWAPTIGGMIEVVNAPPDPNRTLYELFYLAFFLGFFLSFVIFYAASSIFPPVGLGDMDDVDYYGTFTSYEAQKLDIVELDLSTASIDGVKSSPLDEKAPKTEYMATNDPLQALS
ncbi:uracil permease-4 [Coleophoma crateriformis]|uniref:Uracil permease-4 n=1 Tax=Coleophoma crateriformis TaxID=565419 RepID=A0A3D8QTP8_9HELO|nr:uracil permease-4 [Coleophoma crateriformis]